MRLCSQWQQDKTAGAVLTLRCRGQRSRERRLGGTSQSAFHPQRQLRQQIMQTNYGDVKANSVSDSSTLRIRINTSSAASPEEPNAKQHLNCQSQFKMFLRSSSGLERSGDRWTRRSNFTFEFEVKRGRAERMIGSETSPETSAAPVNIHTSRF